MASLLEKEKMLTGLLSVSNTISIAPVQDLRGHFRDSLCVKYVTHDAI